jgi:hypothetical protein
MPPRTLLDDALAQAAEDRQRERDRQNEREESVQAWGRRWLEARRRGGEDREANWYANNRRYR